MKKVIVLGGGVAGLAVSIRLKQKGYKVVLLEKNSSIGGKLAELNLGDYRFDKGPSLFTMPSYLEELFHLANKDINQYFAYEKLDVACNYFFKDKESISMYTSEEKSLSEVSSKLGEEHAERMKMYFQNSQNLFKKSGRLFIEKDIFSKSLFLEKQAWESLPQLVNPKNLETLHKKNKTLAHPKLIQIFDRYATYNGSSPYQAPAMLSMISHLETGIGSFFPLKGMRSIVKSLHRLALEIGVEIHENVEVKSILSEDNMVKGVSSDNGLFKGDFVVSNIDVATTYERLLNDTTEFQKEIKNERSSSGLVFYWGVKGNREELDVHNIVFSEDYKKEFQEIFETHQIPSDPTIYIHISSKINKSDAPDNAENWFVMVNVPPKRISKEIIEKTKSRIIEKLNEQFSIKLETLIEEEEVFQPKDIEEVTGAYQGALYGMSSNGIFKAFKRHPNYSKKYKNLYFVGGTVHPGGGIPLCLNSAKIVSEML